ncbi:MAG: AAA family ATPase [Clostridia bacterium]|nr:AAA family ATPase [Clostridia bacterium]
MSDSRKDEIIRLQNEIIQSMAKRNLRSVYNDFFPASPVSPASPAGGDGKPARPSDEILAGKNGGAAAASTGDGKTTTDAKAEEVPKEKLEDLLAELNGYIGLNTVKEEVDQLVHWIQMQQLRKQHDLPTSDLSLHMVFSGNPGTGKTTIARFLSKIFHSLGILSKGQLVEVDRGDMVAGYVGQTAIKTKDVIDKAMGGVLFIDEAYALTNRGENDYGQEAVDTLLKAMEDHRDDLIVIVAGYIEPMQRFLHSNPGLESRFNRFIDFPDYTLDELMGIFDLRCKSNGYTLEDDARETLRQIIDIERLDAKGFGNARGVRNLFETIIARQADRLGETEGEITREMLMALTLADVTGVRETPPAEQEAPEAPGTEELAAEENEE